MWRNPRCAWGRTPAYDGSALRWLRAPGETGEVTIMSEDERNVITILSDPYLIIRGLESEKVPTWGALGWMREAWKEIVRLRSGHEKSERQIRVKCDEIGALLEVVNAAREITQYDKDIDCCAVCDERPESCTCLASSIRKALKALDCVKHPLDPKDEHNALADARWNRDLYAFL